MSWSPLREEDRNGIITSYHIDCSDENGMSVLNTTTEHTSISLDGLAVGSLYTCYLSAFTSVGGGPAATLNFTISFHDGNYITIKHNMYNFGSLTIIEPLCIMIFSSWASLINDCNFTTSGCSRNHVDTSCQHHWPSSVLSDCCRKNFIHFGSSREYLCRRPQCDNWLARYV